MNDSWFNWLENDFLKYHSEWKENIDNRQGQFPENAKECIFHSWQFMKAFRSLHMQLVKLQNICYLKA